MSSLGGRPGQNDFNVDASCFIAISGGTFVAIGSRGMVMNFSSATQGSALLSAGSQSAGALDYDGTGEGGAPGGNPGGRPGGRMQEANRD